MGGCSGITEDKKERDELFTLSLEDLLKKDKERTALVKWITEDEGKKKKKKKKMSKKDKESELYAYTLKELKSVKERKLAARGRWSGAGLAAMISVKGRLPNVDPSVGEVTPAKKRLMDNALLRKQGLEPLPELTPEELAAKINTEKCTKLGLIGPVRPDGTRARKWSEALKMRRRRLTNQDLIDRMIRESIRCINS